MKKRLLSCFLTCVLLLSPAYAALLPNFAEVNTYKEGQFTDVPTTEWYAENVATAYRLGIINGKTATRFDPKGNLTLAETVKLACVIHSIYTTGKSTFAAGNPWYRPYVDYAIQNKLLLSEYANYDKAATRADFALLFSRALPADALASINTVEDGAIPDVPASSAYANAVYTLYRAGILTGSDAKGNFRPTTQIARSEAAAITTRMANTDLRRTVTLKAGDTSATLTAEQIFAACAPAVFYLEIYDKNGKSLGSGSGFFLSADGRAVTNYHVIDNAYSAKAFTKDGKEHKITGIYGGDEKLDLAVVQVEGSGYPVLTRGDSKNITTGSTVYAIGSPLGLDSTISQGIVSYASRTIEDSEYIQITTPISPGSSGGALIDAKGKVIGVTAAFIMNDGENINLAVPIHKLDELKTNATTAGLPGTTSTTKYYDGYYPVPDFGAFSGVSLYAKGTDDDYVGFAYRASAFDGKEEETINGYVALLEKNGFSYIDSYKTDDGKGIYLVYQNGSYKLQVEFGVDFVEGVQCYMVWITKY